MADKSLLAGYLQARANNWLKLSDIKTAITDVPERTLRRWLTTLVEQGLVLRSGETKGAQYQWIDQASSHDQPAEATITDLLFSEVSQTLLEQTTAPLYTRSPVTYSEEWIDRYTPNQTFYLSDDQRALLHQQGKRHGIQGKARTYIQKIFNRMLIDLSYNSARLEGNTYSLADTEQLVLRGVSVEGKLNEERIMILNHKEAIRYLVQNIDDVATDENTVRTLHYLLADSLVAPGMAGQIREESIGVSGTTYAPLEGKERLADFLIVLLTKAANIDDCFEQSFFLLGHIAYLQAFVDVNKRTARLASIIPLITQDYVPQSFVDVQKDDYLKAMICFYEFNRTEPLAELYVWSYLRSCRRYDVSAKVIGFDEISALYRTQRRAIVGNVIREQVPLQAVSSYLEKNIPTDIAQEHYEKFKADVMNELHSLDSPRLAGLGITKEQMLAWKKISAT